MIKEIFQWNEIASKYQDNLIIGNGGAIAIAPNHFAYSDLFDFALKNGLIKENVRDIFRQVEPRNPDFERVLYQLWMADFINQRFELEKSQMQRIRQGYTAVRRSLIDTIKSIHPSYGEVNEKLVKVGQFICQFKTVYYLNYDLLLYWASLTVNHFERHRCKDGFNVQVAKVHNQKTKTLEFTDNLELIWEPYRSDRATAIFYPHGSLMLYQTRVTKAERKLGLSGDKILQKITDFWASNDAQPLFVCEGTTSEKLKSISGSDYLTTVYQKALPRISNTLVIYGWNIGEQDQHILKQIKGHTLEYVAISIYVSGKSENSLNQTQQYFISRLDGLIPPNNIEFFDSSSANCWCN